MTHQLLYVMFFSDGAIPSKFGVRVQQAFSVFATRTPQYWTNRVEIYVE